MPPALITLLADKTSLSPNTVRNILTLLDGGATIPFIARHPMEVLSVNQYLAQIEVISIDVEQGKVGLRLL